MRINIAIDGPSAAGKSSVAKKICEILGYIHLDTGAMYRCVAYKSLKQKLDTSDEQGIVEMLKNTTIELKSTGEIFLDGVDVSKDIRTNEISMRASAVSKLLKVREDLVKRQKELTLAKGVIMDGRDIGTVVIPNAEVKIFLTATAAARANRRFIENKEKGITGDIQQMIKEIEQRDYQDTHRKNSPLIKADDAIVVDTSLMSFDEVVERILKIAQEKIGVI